MKPENWIETGHRHVAHVPSSSDPVMQIVMDMFKGNIVLGTLLCMISGGSKGTEILEAIICEEAVHSIP